MICTWCETESALEVCKECRRWGLHRFSAQEAELVKTGDPRARPEAVRAEARRWSSDRPVPVRWRDATFTQPARDEEARRLGIKHRPKDRRQ